MFEKLKRKLIHTAKKEVDREVVESADKGILHSSAVIMELLIVAGVVLLGTRGNVSAASKTTTVIIKNCNIIFK